MALDIYNGDIVNGSGSGLTGLSGGTVNWGDIVGTITDQVDLDTELNKKQNKDDYSINFLIGGM